jgi:hypothetical protein
MQHVVRVERTLKGAPVERVILRSRMTSCQVAFDVGRRIGVAYRVADDILACDVVDPDALIAASALPAPSGTPRFAVALEGVEGLNAVLLGARGQVAGYEAPQGEVLAQGSCGRAVRGPDDEVRLDDTELPLRDVAAVGCTDNGRRAWAVGSDGTQVRLVTVRNGQVQERMRRPADVATIAGARAYFGQADRVRIVPLNGGRARSARIEGRFASLSGNGDRVAGRLRDGRSAVLDVRTGKLVTRQAGNLVWLREDRLLGADGIYDAGLRRLRAVSTRGTLVGVAGGAAFFADGSQLLRLSRAARRAARFAELPGRATSIIAVSRARASATLWHSCEESAKDPLTT